MEQSQFRVVSPSISTYRRNVVNENPVPLATSVSPALEKLTHNLRDSLWENEANIARLPSFARGLSMREEERMPQTNIARGA